MKVNRDDILWFLNNIRRKYPEANDTQLADHLASYMEANPRCIDMEGVSHPGRFRYSTVGYGVFSLLGEKYTMGRIEVFDSQDESGYAVHERPGRFHFSSRADGSAGARGWAVSDAHDAVGGIQVPR